VVIQCPGDVSFTERHMLLLLLRQGLAANTL
jgi:hypothetical protein